MQKKSAFLAEWTNEMELMLKKTEKRVYRSNKKIMEKQKKRGEWHKNDRKCIIYIRICKHFMEMS